MTRFRLGFILGALAMVAVANGCFIGVDDFSKPCSKDTDCPKIGGYLCASAATWPQALCDSDAGGCLCEVKFPPDPYDAGPPPPPDGGKFDAGYDAGPPPYVDAGPPIDYCTDIRPVMQAKCLFTCHSAQMGYPQSPTDFRLDYYLPPDAGAFNDGGIAFLPGLYDKAGRCYARMIAGDMPPDQQTFPGYTLTEKTTFAKWLDGGAQLGSGTCEAAKPKDGGTDGGADAGPTISFSVDVQPILTTSCATVGCHTGATPTGTLNLSTGNSYNALVNINTSAGCNAGGSKRVLAFDIKNSMLWQKLTPDGGYCNNSMPRNLVILRNQQPANFAKIEAWIAQGAKNN